MDRKFEKLEEGQVNLERRMTELEKDRKKLSEVTESLSTSIQQNDYKLNDNLNQLREQLQEEKDRLRRANNILIMGLPENDSGLRLAYDLMKVLLPTITVTILDQRVGIQKPNNNRPLRIHLSNAAEVRSALNNTKKIKGNPAFASISVRKDMTKKQREDNHQRMMTRSQSASAGQSLFTPTVRIQSTSAGRGSAQLSTTQKRKADEELYRASKSSHADGNTQNSQMDI
jgi:hypothetical protein